MPEFFTVTKGGEKKQVLAGRQLERAIAEGWAETGTKRVETETGERTVEAKEARKRIRSGEAERLVGEEEIVGRAGEQYLEDRYGDQGAYAFGLGGLSSVPLVGAPIAGAIAETASGDPGELAGIRSENKGAFTAGEVLSTVAQAAAPFALAGKAGKVAGYTPGGLISRGASALGTRAGTGKATQLAAEGIADGAAWTVAQNHANAVIEDKPLNVEMLVAGLPMNMVTGGVLGGAIGKLSTRLDAEKIAKAGSNLDNIDDWNAAHSKLQQDVLDAKKAYEATGFDVGDAQRLAKQEGKLAGAANKEVKRTQKALDDFLKQKKPVEAVAAAQGRPVREGLEEFAESLADDIFDHAERVGTRKQARAVTDLIHSGKYLDGTADDLNRLLGDYAELGHQGTVFNERNLKGMSEGFPEFAATKLTDDAGQLSPYAQKLEGVDLNLVSDPGSASLVRSWAANQDATALKRGLEAPINQEAKLLADLDAAKGTAADAQAYNTAAGSGVDATLDARQAAKRELLDKRNEVSQFKLDNVKPAKPVAPKKPEGLVAQLSDATIGRMSRTLSFGQEKISSGVRGFIKLAGKPRRGTVPAASTILSRIRFDADVGEKPKNRKDQFKRVAKELDDVMSNPEGFKQRIHKANRSAAMLKPALSDAMASKAMERMQFLHGLLPRSPHVSAFGPDRWQASQTEIDKFARIAAAAEDPYSIIDDLNAGKLTQEGVDTVKQLYPEIYHSIQMEIISNAEQIKQSVDYKGRLQLGILFGVPTDTVLEPKFVQVMQENYALRAQEQEQAASGGGNQYSTPGNNQKAIASTATTSQRLEVAD